VEKLYQKLVEYFSRKFVLSLASLFGTFGLILLGKEGITDQLNEIIGLVLGTYGASNVAEKYAEGKNQRKLNERALEIAAENEDQEPRDENKEDL
jgi:hypothetical protein